MADPETAPDPSVLPDAVAAVVGDSAGATGATGTTGATGVTGANGAG
jgi:hypothetical protein